MSEEAFTLVGDRTGLTVKAEVPKGVMVTTPTDPTKTDRGRGAGVRTVMTEAGRRRNNGVIGRILKKKYL